MGTSRVFASYFYLCCLRALRIKSFVVVACAVTNHHSLHQSVVFYLHSQSFPRVLPSRYKNTPTYIHWYFLTYFSRGLLPAETATVYVSHMKQRSLTQGTCTDEIPQNTPCAPAQGRYHARNLQNMPRVLPTGRACCGRRVALFCGRSVYGWLVID